MQSYDEILRFARNNDFGSFSFIDVVLKKSAPLRADFEMGWLSGERLSAV